MRILARRLRETDEKGVSLIEVLVAFIIFSIITAALVPALITSIKHTARNASIGTASQLVNSRIEEFRAGSQYMTCGDLFTDIASRVDYFEDDRGVRFEVTSEIWQITATDTLLLDGSCATDYVTVYVNARAVDAMGLPLAESILPDPVATATTEVYLPNQVVTP